MIFLFTDFGYDGPYVGQMTAAIRQFGWAGSVINLMHDAPRYNPKAAAYLLAACVTRVPPGSIVCAVVDPGVGGPRPPIVMKADDKWFVGPGNGLFEIVRRRSRTATSRRLDFEADEVSVTFHGRDLFAPAAALIAKGDSLQGSGLKCTLPGHDWPDDLAEIIYIDGYGNAMTGLRSSCMRHFDRLVVNDQRIPRAAKFADVDPGQAFFYENSLGLTEIAVNQGRADQLFHLQPGTAVNLPT